MIRIKTFTTYDPDKKPLDEAVNEYLKEIEGQGFKILDIKPSYSVAHAPQYQDEIFLVNSVLITYDIPEKKEKKK